MNNLQISPQEAATELLKRRKARNSLLSFIEDIAIEPSPAAHHRLLIEKLQAVVDGTLKRLMVFMPPGTAKSTYCSVLLPAYYLGVHDKRRVIAASYDTGLSTLFGRRVRNLVASPDYQRLFPIGMAQDTKAKGEWDVGTGGGYYATGVGSAVTGRRGNLVVLDDLIKGRKDADSPTVRDSTWEWYRADLRTRMIPDRNQMVFVMTRWHEDDPAGRILPSDWDGSSGLIRARDGEIWDVLSLPAQACLNDPLGRKEGEWLWTEWFSPEYWEQEKRTQLTAGTRNWSALYQQQPSPDEGTYFKREWFKWYSEPPERLSTYIGGDFAVTEGSGDFTEIGVVGIDIDDDMYVAPNDGWFSGQSASDTWIDAIIDLAKEHETYTLISEKGVIRNAIEPFLEKRFHERKTYLHCEWLPHIGDKAANARAFQARASQGKVYLPDNDIGHRILNQLLAFPTGKYDDIVDVLGIIGRYVQSMVAAGPKPLPVAGPETDAWGRTRVGSDWKTI